MTVFVRTAQSDKDKKSQREPALPSASALSTAWKTVSDWQQAAGNLATSAMVGLLRPSGSRAADQDAVEQPGSLDVEDPLTVDEIRWAKDWLLDRLAQPKAWKTHLGSPRAERVLRLHSGVAHTLAGDKEFAEWRRRSRQQRPAADEPTETQAPPAPPSSLPNSAAPQKPFVAQPLRAPKIEISPDEASGRLVITVDGVPTFAVEGAGRDTKLDVSANDAGQIGVKHEGSGRLIWLGRPGSDSIGPGAGSGSKIAAPESAPGLGDERRGAAPESEGGYSWSEVDPMLPVEGSPPSRPTQEELFKQNWNRNTTREKKEESLQYGPPPIYYTQAMRELDAPPGGIEALDYVLPLPVVHIGWQLGELVAGETISTMPVDRTQKAKDIAWESANAVALDLGMGAVLHGAGRFAKGGEDVAESALKDASRQVPEAHVPEAKPDAPVPESKLAASAPEVNPDPAVPAESSSASRQAVNTPEPELPRADAAEKKAVNANRSADVSSAVEGNTTQGVQPKKGGGAGKLRATIKTPRKDGLQRVSPEARATIERIFAPDHAKIAAVDAEMKTVRASIAGLKKAKATAAQLKKAQAALNKLKADRLKLTMLERVRAALGRVRDERLLEWVNRYHGNQGFNSVLVDLAIGGNKREGARFVMFDSLRLPPEDTAVAIFEMEDAAKHALATSEPGQFASGGYWRRSDLWVRGARTEYKSVFEIRAGAAKQLEFDVISASAGELDNWAGVEQALARRRWVFDAEKMTAAKLTEKDVVQQLADRLFGPDSMLRHYPEEKKAAIRKLLEVMVVFR